jgi:hypothetical protein
VPVEGVEADREECLFKADIYMVLLRAADTNCT